MGWAEGRGVQFKKEILHGEIFENKDWKNYLTNVFRECYMRILKYQNGGFGVQTNHNGHN